MRILLSTLLLVAAACGPAVEATSRGDLDGARAAVAALWPELEARSLSRPAWEARAAAAAAALREEQAPDLLSIARDQGATPLERVAAAELYRRLAGRRARLGEAELAWLRATAFGGLPGAALPSAARRVLADLGDWGDRLQLVRELETTPDPVDREVAAWCLQAAGTEQELCDLARLLGPRFPAPVRGLAAATLAAIVRGRSGSAPVGPELREELVGDVLDALDAPDCPPELEQPACALLAALGGPRALGRLELLAGAGRLDGGSASGQIPE